MNLWMEVFHVFHKQEFILQILPKKKKINVIFLLLYILASILNVWSISKSSEK